MRIGPPTTDQGRQLPRTVPSSSAKRRACGSCVSAAHAVPPLAHPAAVAARCTALTSTVRHFRLLSSWLGAVLDLIRTITADTILQSRRLHNAVAGYVLIIRTIAAAPDKELKAFAKVTLEPGAAAEVRFELHCRDFAIYDPRASAWTTSDGVFELLIGAWRGHPSARKHNGHRRPGARDPVQPP